MKMMKKTLSLLLTAAIVMSLCSIAAFAETAMTEIPNAPAETQMYVRLQADSSVLSDPSKTTTVTLPKRGIFVNTSSIILRFNTDQFYSGAEYATSTTGNNRMKNTPTAFRLGLESLETEGTQVTLNSGYLMVHTSNVKIWTATDSANPLHGFGYSAESQLTNAGDRMAQFQILSNQAVDDGAFKIKVYDGVTEKVATLDASDWVESGVAFDLKMLVNLVDKTYDVYINDRPVVLSAKAGNTGISKIALLINGKKNYTQCASFGETVCYGMNVAEVSQLRQAAMERAFNQSFTEDNAKGTLFYTHGAATAPSADYTKLFGNDSTAYKSFKCDGVTNLTFDKAAAGDAEVARDFEKVYFTADNMTAYNYDNLSYIYVSAPVYNDNTGETCGTYELAGGKGMQYTPVVLTALFADTEKTQLVKVVCADGEDGVYSATLDDVLAGGTLDCPAATAFVWGGRTKLVPLFPTHDFSLSVE